MYLRGVQYLHPATICWLVTMLSTILYHLDWKQSACQLENGIVTYQTCWAKDEPTLVHSCIKDTFLNNSLKRLIQRLIWRTIYRLIERLIDRLIWRLIRRVIESEEEWKNQRFVLRSLLSSPGSFMTIRIFIRIIYGHHKKEDIVAS